MTVGKQLTICFGLLLLLGAGLGLEGWLSVSTLGALQDELAVRDTQALSLAYEAQLSASRLRNPAESRKAAADLDACLSSPKARALDTARIACRALGVSVEVTEELKGGDFDPGALAAGRGKVLLVGHEPDFSRAIAAATGARIQLKKGGLAQIDDGKLIALLHPAQLRAIAS